MIQVSYPGVYIQEKASGVRTITGVATSIAAFIDSFQRGPLDEAVQCLSFADFEKEFGGLEARSEASYGIKQFFQNGGGEAWVVRVASDDAVPAEATITDDVAGAGSDIFRARAGRRIRAEPAFNPGAWGDGVHIEIDYDTQNSATLFNVKVSEIRTANGRRSVLRTEIFRNLTMEADAPREAIEVVNEGSRLVQLDRDGMTAVTRPAANGTLGTPLAVGAAVPASPVNLTIDAGAGPRTVTVTYGAVPPKHPEMRALLEQAIHAAAEDAATQAERAVFAGASVKLLGRDTADEPYRYHVIGGQGGPGFDPARILNIGGAAAADLGFPGTANWQQYQLAGGNDGTLPVDDAALLGSEADKSGIYALEDVDLFNILCIPRAAALDEAPMSAVYADATAYCQRRRAFLIIDIPEATDSVDDMQTWLGQNSGLRNRLAAAYFPRVFVPNPLNENRLRNIGASGTIAGLYARTDAARGVWKAPAGTDAQLRNVQGLAYPLTDAENGTLNPLGVNCLRDLPVYGRLSWGARTLDGADQLASEWKYIPIMRLTLFIEESLYRGTKWVVFEPNDEPLWAKIRLNVGVFMNGLFRQGAFQGSSPDQAYYVKCDAETTTQADRNLGIVNIEVGFAPLKPAEFVVITIQQIAGDLQT